MDYKKVIMLCAVFALGAAGAASAYTASYYAPASALADGNWVKVDVDTTAIYEISYDRLRELGFADPSKVGVYGYGPILAGEHEFISEYPDDMPATACLHTADGRLLFYGEGPVRTSITASTSSPVSVVRNYYSTTGSYFLSDKGTPEAPKYVDFAGGDNTFSTLGWNYCIDYIEREVNNPGQGGVFFHGPRLKAGEIEKFTYRIRNFAPDVTNIDGVFYYSAAVKSPSQIKVAILPQDNINITDNSTVACAASTSPVRMWVSAYGTAKFRPSVEKPLSDVTTTFSLQIPVNFAGSYAAIDKAYIYYPRTNALEQAPYMVMNFKKPSTSQMFRVSDIDAGVEVWNITNPGNIYAYTLDYDAEARTARGVFAPNVTSKTPQRLVVFDPARTQRKPLAIRKIECQNLHGTETPDILIVTTEANLPAAQDLANIHRTLGGLEVVVATQDQIFNEFSSGVRTPAAVRRLQKMYLDRDDDYKYLILYGTTHWDQRGITRDISNVLIGFETDLESKARESATNYCSDFYFGMLADNYSHADIGKMPTQISVGRLPVTNPAAGMELNEKIRDYLLNPPTARQYLNILAMSDDGDSRGHTKQSELAIDELKALLPSCTVYRDDLACYPTIDSKKPGASEVLRRVLSAGMGYFTYSGHGDSKMITGENLYTSTQVKNYSYSKLPFTMFATCDTYPLDRESGSLVENMVNRQNGGVIAAVGACRSVYMEHNKTINTLMAQAYASATGLTRIGDIVRAARNTMVSGAVQTGLFDNTMCFNLCGDPALPLGVPTYDIKVASIAGNSNTDTAISAQPYTKINVKADVINGTGRKVAAFNGRAIIDVYEPPCQRNDQTEGMPDTLWTCDDVILMSMTTTVVDGTIDTDICFPSPLTQGTGRIVITAQDVESRLTAATPAALYLDFENTDADTFAEDIDTSAPVIEEIYIDEPAFVAGDAVGHEFTLYARVDPSAIGLATRIWGMKPTSTLTMDNTLSFPYALNDMHFGDDGKIMLAVPVTNVSDGHHSLTLTIVNNAGASATKTIDFCVVNHALRGSLSSDLDAGAPARSDVTLSLKGVSQSTICRRLIITDHSGATVRSEAACSLPFRWDLTDNYGNAVPDGRYSVSALLEDDTRFGHTAPLEIVVLK